MITTTDIGNSGPLQDDGGVTGDTVANAAEVAVSSLRTRAPAAGPFRVRLQVMSGDEGAIGPGKAALLESIGETGSISAAGRALGISYRRCWLMVDEMNRCWNEPLVEVQRGGKDQGARVSMQGLAVLSAYRALGARLMADIDAAPETGLLRGSLREQPLNPGTSVGGG
jgi:molybdate transport system regulatory protein